MDYKINKIRFLALFIFSIMKNYFFGELILSSYDLLTGYYIITSNKRYVFILLNLYTYKGIRTLMIDVTKK